MPAEILRQRIAQQLTTPSLKAPTTSSAKCKDGHQWQASLTGKHLLSADSVRKRHQRSGHHFDAVTSCSMQAAPKAEAMIPDGRPSDESLTSHVERRSCCQEVPTPAMQAVVCWPSKLCTCLVEALVPQEPSGEKGPAGHAGEQLAGRALHVQPPCITANLVLFNLRRLPATLRCNVCFEWLRCCQHTAVHLRI